MSTPRGIRNNNPMNLMYNKKIPWRGMIAPDKDGYCCFTTPHDGIRAGARDIATGFKRDHEDTVRVIITEFAPPTENDTNAYIDAVCRATGFEPDQHLTFGFGAIYALVPPIIQHENGQQPYDLWLIHDAVMDALNS